MLTLLGPKHRYCDGVSRRSFLKIGGLVMGGLSLPELLRAEEQGPSPRPSPRGRGGNPSPRPSAGGSGSRGSHKAVIMVYLSGGLSHQDTFDLKPEAPAEIRGEFQPIATNVAGIEVCELLPRTATIMDRVALIRSIVGLRDEHTSSQNLAGCPQRVALAEDRPNFGAVIGRLQGATEPVVPPFVDLFPTMQHRPYNSPGPGMLGQAYAAVKADGEDLASMKLRYVSQMRFGDRRRLLAGIDQFRRGVDAAGLEAMDSTYQRRFDVLTSNKVVDALDVEKEDPRLRERYGKGSPQHIGDGAPMWNDQLLVARRLVEAGVRCVTVAFGFWDTHGDNFGSLRLRLPTFDQGVSALIEDVYDRGLDRDVSVVVWGEFGRTPTINKDAGRDHWPRVSFALLSGGGMRTGQVIGSTDKIAAYAASRPVHYQDVLATVYHNLGIDPHANLTDRSGRPVPLLPHTAQPIGELV